MELADTCQDRCPYGTMCSCTELHGRDGRKSETDELDEGDSLSMTRPITFECRVVYQPLHQMCGTRHKSRDVAKWHAEEIRLGNVALDDPVVEIEAVAIDEFSETRS